MRKTDRDYIRELKSQTELTGYRVPIGDGMDCKVRIIARGEMAFYQEGDRALLLEIDVQGGGAIFRRSIREWDTGERVTEAEREAVVEHVARALRAGGASDVRVV